jgi:hypothetical protein
MDLVVGENVLDEVYTAEYGAVRWEVTLTRADGARIYRELNAVHDRTTARGYATTGYYSVFAEITTDHAAAAQIKLKTVLNGSGAAQVVQLRAVLTGSWWRAYIHRGPLVGTGETT